MALRRPMACRIWWTRLYRGTAGRLELGHIGVFLASAGHAVLDRTLSAQSKDERP